MKLHWSCCDVDWWVLGARDFDEAGICPECEERLHLEPDSDIDALCAEWKAGYQ